MWTPESPDEAAAVLEFLDRERPFPKQDLFVDDPSQFLAAQCTRRAGKTSAIAKKFLKTMKKYPGSLSRYIALTRTSARDIMWPVLQDFDEKYQLNAHFTESNLTMTLENGAQLKLFGADMKNFIRRLKGVKSPAIAVDESQDFGNHLSALVDDVLTPSIVDYEDSWIALTGTPGPLPMGMFFNITQGGADGYSIHKWSLFENPYLPNAREFVENLKRRKHWDDRNPTYLREYQNEWVLDLETLLIRYSETTNHYEKIPKLPWNYILGVDIGHRDADALAVLAWSEASPEIYLVEEKITQGQDLTELEHQIFELMSRYDISKIVMDEGALGKKIGEEFRRRKHIPVIAAEKSGKMTNIAFLNEALRLGRFKAKKTSRFASDSYLVQIDHEKTTPDRLVVKRGFHSDIIDAVLYAFKESKHYTYESPPPPSENKGREEVELFWARQAEAIEKQEEATWWDTL